jgi:hypothetical protein
LLFFDDVMSRKENVPARSAAASRYDMEAP